MGKREQIFRIASPFAVKPTRPSLATSAHIAKGYGASVQMSRCCLEIIFKSALAPFLNALKP